MHLTYHDSPPKTSPALPASPGDAGAPEIEITPAMIEAGIEELSLFDLHDPARWKVPCVYRAMEAARRNAPDQATASATDPCLKASAR
jgi:hypothetical protein